MMKKQQRYIGEITPSLSVSCFVVYTFTVLNFFMAGLVFTVCFWVHQQNAISVKNNAKFYIMQKK